MNTTNYERPALALARKSNRSEKNKKVLDEKERRAQRRLYAVYELMRCLGKKFNVSQISQKHGYTRSRAGQVLNGHEPLNDTWMLIWSVETGVSPVDIWEEDWPFHDATPSRCPAFAALLRRWESLPQERRQQIGRLFREG